MPPLWSQWFLSCFETVSECKRRNAGYRTTHIAIDKFEDQRNLVSLYFFRLDLGCQPSLSRIRLPRSSADIIVMSHGTSSRGAGREGFGTGSDVPG